MVKGIISMVLAQLPQGKSPQTLTNPNFNPGGGGGGGAIFLGNKGKQFYFFPVAAYFHGSRRVSF